MPAPRKKVTPTTTNDARLSEKIQLATSPKALARWLAAAALAGLPLNEWLRRIADVKADELGVA